MIPVQDVIPTRTTPVATMTLIGLNVLAFLIQLLVGYPGVTSSTLVESQPSAVVDAGRALVSVFAHSGTLQFVMNVLFLWLFGGNVEDQMGRRRFVLLYVVCGSGAAIAQGMLDSSSEVPLIGASAAIAGVIGAYFVLYPRSRVLMFFPVPPSLHEIPAVFFLAVWVVLQLITVAATSSIASVEDRVAPALVAQIFGFVTGALLCPLFRRPERARVEWWGA